MLKLYNGANGLFYSLYGLWGLILPHRLAAFLGIETPSTLALHQIRALWAGIFAMGVLILWFTVKRLEQGGLALCLVLVTLALATGRIIGMAFDGSGIQQTYMETGFEIFWAGLGFLLYKSRKV